MVLWAFHQAAEEMTEAHGKDCECSLCSDLLHWSYVVDGLTDVVGGALLSTHQLVRHYTRVTGSPPPGRWDHERLDLLDKIVK